MFSQKINDPAFAKFLQSSNRWSITFSFVLALLAVIGFTIYGEVYEETNGDMGNPQAFFIGLGIGVLFISIALLQIISRKQSRTWEGTVVDKTSKKKRRKLKSSDMDENIWEDYMVFTVYIRNDSGKMYKISTENDDILFNYYQIGDRARHHGGLNTYEKFDKSKDTIIFCNACSTLNDIQVDYCVRCNCPLLK